MGVIYRITCKTTDKVYIGQTVDTAMDRFKRHVRAAKSGRNECPLLDAAIRKYGVNDFTLETIIECADKELDFHEIRLIEEHQSIYPGGYNMKAGGQDGNQHHSDISKQKISQGLRKYKDMDVPMHVIYHKRRGCEGFIVAYPNTKKGYFTSTEFTLEENLEKAKEYLESVKQGIIPVINRNRYCEDLEIELPQYLDYYSDKDIFRVRKKGYPTKQWGSNKGSITERLDMATEYIKSIGGFTRPRKNGKKE